MSTAAQAEFARLLGGKIYPALFSDGPYCEFLFNAGLFGDLPGTVTSATKPEKLAYIQRIAKSAPRQLESLSAANQSRLAEQARNRAHIIFGELASRDAVRIGAANAGIIGPLTRIYRVWDSRSPGSIASVWWFDQKLLDLCRQESGPTSSDRFAWLRDACAVCFDWSGFDRLAVLTLQGAEEVPVIEAVGLPMRSYSQANKYTPVQYMPWNNPNVDMADYWRRIGTMLAGGRKQLFLPFIPHQRIRPISSL